MTHIARYCSRTLSAVLIFGALLLTADRGAIAAARSAGSLTLRVNPAIATPGGVFAVVLRTYAPRSIRQGQVLVKVVRPPVKAARRSSRIAPAFQAAQPIARLLSATVFSVQGDSVTQTSLNVDATGEQALVKFSSPSASINAADGPMVVFLFQLDPSVAPGQQFDLQIDPKVCTLIDGEGKAVVIDPRPALLTVRAPDAPLTLQAEGNSVAAGTAAEVGVQTLEPFLISSGRIALRYDPSFAGGVPAVRMDPRYGSSTFTVDASEPGLLVVDFQSPDNTLNSVPGTFIAVSLPVAANAAVGSVSPVTLDPAQTWLLSRQGAYLPLTLESGALQIR